MQPNATRGIGSTQFSVETGLLRDAVGRDLAGKEDRLRFPTAFGAGQTCIRPAWVLKAQRIQ
jgi:hypothetical protein